MPGFSTNPFSGDAIDPDLTLEAQESFFVDSPELQDVIARLTADRGGHGRIILLMAPRAGYGKTFLLKKLAAELQDRASLVTLPIPSELMPNWVNLYQGLLERLSSSKAEQAPTQLDEIIRRILATATADLIREGQIPSSDQAEAEKQLLEQPLRSFDFGMAEETAVCLWFRNSYTALSPALVQYLTRKTDLQADAVGGWLDVLYHFTAVVGGENGENRKEALRKLHEIEPASKAPCNEQASQEAGHKASKGSYLDQISSRSLPQTTPKGTAPDHLESWAKQRLLALCSLMSIPQPLVIIFDGLDGFFGSPEKGRMLACKIIEIQADTTENSVLLGLNNDLWQSVFDKHLPSAHKDRLTSDVINLEGISPDDAEALLRGRMTRAGIEDEKISAFLDLVALQNHCSSEKWIAPRKVLRIAAEKWQEIKKGGKRAAPPQDEPDAPQSDRPLQDAPQPDDPTPLDLAGSDAPLNIFNEDLRGSFSEAMKGLMDKGAPEKEGKENGKSMHETPTSAPVLTSAPTEAHYENPVWKNTTENAVPEPSPPVPSTQPTSQEAALSFFYQDDDSQHPLLAEIDQRLEVEEACPPILPESGETRSTPASQGKDTAATFAHIKQMLQQLRREKEREQTSTTGHPKSHAEQDASGRAHAPDHGLVSARSTDEIMTQGPSDRLLSSKNLVTRGPEFLRARFQQLLAEQAPDHSNGISQDKIARIVRTAGQHLPHVHLSNFKLNKESTEIISKWTHQNREILFGFAPFASRNYWEALSLFVTKRAASKNTPDRRLWDPATCSMIKFAVFASPSQEKEARFLYLFPATDLLDLIILSRAEEASLYAADILLEQARLGEITNRPADVLVALATELEPIWERITRPLPIQNMS